MEFLRRKGNKDTLLAPDGTPVAGGEAALRPYLAGADREFFIRMFSLDHVRPSERWAGNPEAKDDMGQMLFSAGSGIGGLRECLDELAGEADGLWSARRAKRRNVFVAEDKLKQAQDTLRELMLTANKWRELKRAYEDAEERAYSRSTKKSGKPAPSATGCPGFGG